MAKTWCLLFLLAMNWTAFGQSASPQVDCAPISQSFEQLVQEFHSEWTGAADFCGFKRFIALNQMVIEDMTLSPKRYEQRMAHLHQIKNSGNEEAINYLLLSFQESWFNVHIDSILLRERSRISTWSRWLTIGAASSTAAIMILPFTRRYKAKPMILMRKGLQHFLKKRAFAFASTAISSQADRLIFKKGAKATETFVAPPLFFGADDELDERTDNVHLKEMQEDMISATGGIVTGWFIGHWVSVAVRDRVAVSWAATPLGRYKWTQWRLAKFASPGLIAGAAVTGLTTNWVSNTTSEILFQKRFDEIRSGIMEDVRLLSEAVKADNEFVIFSKAEKLKNDLSLQNFLLTRELGEALDGASNSVAEKILNEFSFCIEPREMILKRRQEAFSRKVAKLIAAHSRNVKAALLLAQSAQGGLLATPHPLSEPLTGANDKLMMRTTWLLDATVTAEDLWQDIVAAIDERPVKCPNVRPEVPQ